ncbi:DUF7533 family protein [Halorubrum sp. DTA46]|uniref:DUF7533 family protein n=1 Tax=Halorubrum sp. DTA46 TaxID=3402162 RepID=UPI003AAE8C3F
MRLGLTDMIGLAASLIFAIPLGNFALIRLLAGEVALGVGLLVVAAAMVILPQYFLDPGRIVRGLLSGLLPRQLRGDPSEGESSTTESSAAEPSAVASADDAPDK